MNVTIALPMGTRNMRLVNVIVMGTGVVIRDRTDDCFCGTRNSRQQE